MKITLERDSRYFAFAACHLVACRKRSYWSRVRIVALLVLLLLLILWVAGFNWAQGLLAVPLFVSLSGLVWFASGKIRAYSGELIPGEDYRIYFKEKAEDAGVLSIVFEGDSLNVESPETSLETQISNIRRAVVERIDGTDWVFLYIGEKIIPLPLTKELELLLREKGIGILWIMR